ncbi:MAG: 16S rRNA (uracil(1498)-N(3))-methyltransferase [Oscillospiraceae bacterium]|nr:16S rRNA (uracil(1498)-N(3))-methyltransferase [Oscillospiraceae bacterium]
MPRFFAEENNISENSIHITGSDARHISYSLRMKKGERITFCREGTEYLCTITDITETDVYCHIDETLPSDCEPDVRLTIYQALPKSDKMELIIQKTVELGAFRIVPFISKRCVSRPDDKSAAKKQLRWQRIAEEAAKQSGRGIIPRVSPILSFEDMLKELEQNKKKLICYENGGISLTEADISDKCSDIAVVIGAEGGFERAEVDKASEKGAVPIWLGKRILRCETCPIAVTSVIMSMTGNF